MNVLVFVHSHSQSTLSDEQINNVHLTITNLKFSAVFGTMSANNSNFIRPISYKGKVHHHTKLIKQRFFMNRPHHSTS